jgi:hypothetical protein
MLEAINQVRLYDPSIRRFEDSNVSFVEPILDIQGLQSPTSRTGLSPPLDLIIPAIEHTPPAQIITNYHL